MKKILTIEIQCDKTYKALEALIDCNIGIQCFYDYLANSEKFEFAFPYKTINTLAKQIDKFRRLMLDGLQEKYNCNENAEYHKNLLYGFAGLKCRQFMHAKAQLNFLCRVFMDLAKESNIDYIIFKKENN